MQTKTRTATRIGTAVIALALIGASHAQLQEPPIPGTYYSTKDFDWSPPWPFNPFPELDAVEIAPGIFVFDDTAIPDTPAQAAARQRHEETAALAQLIAADPILAAAARQAAQEAARQREADWQARLQAAQPLLRSWGLPGQAETQQAREEARTELQELARKAAEARADVPRLDAELDDISRRLNMPRERVHEDGSKELLGGHVGGQPVYYSSQNLWAAASISADELWPTNSTPWPGASTGRSLTGTNVTLGLWEVDGAVMTNHLEFTNLLNRVRQVDHSATNPIPLAGHATAVAGTMAAGGNLQFSIGGVPARWLRGVAFQATVNAYDTKNLAVERLQAAGGVVTGQPLRLANHSWGAAGGWIYRTIAVLQGGQTNSITTWVWRGDPALAEEWKFGFYTPGAPWISDGSGCADTDSFLASDAARHLMVYAAGNDRLIGPGNPTNYYYYTGPGDYDWISVTNPPAGSRDWRNGDGNTGGYDTVLAPGTAKNVLTVGAVRDVYYVSNSLAYLGYATNAVVTLAPFSGCGPTDDGRIKPDVVAVGQSNSTIRSYGILTPATNAVDGFYITQAGTSFAAPGVSGGLCLAMQRRHQLWPNLDPNLDAWRGSTWKTLAMHTADDVDAPGPDYQMGYGLFNAVSCVAQIELDQQHGRGTHIKEFQLALGQALAWEVDLTNGVPFRATLGWSDQAGPATNQPVVDPTTPMLVNNLDLRAEPVGTTNVFRPWVLNPDLTNKTEAVRSAAATTGVDNRNNLEQVFIANPPSGRYRIVVTHSGGLTGGPSPSAQWATLQTTGDTPLPPVFTAIEPSPSGTNMLLTFTADPGAHFHLLTSTNLVNWETNATVKAEAVTNSILVEATDPYRFWNLRRQQ
ncbi:MAG TPA: S8 family serine peptidase [Verrucomicrobiota bacterium]|nr:S8 family serine peptidase [Verrucomicrobiota bacterium]HNU51923.1 S8 family serine peptidase [Verrucomicrobiota bacterium]